VLAVVAGLTHYWDHLQPVADVLMLRGVDVQVWRPAGRWPPRRLTAPTLVAGHRDIRYTRGPVAMLNHGAGHTYRTNHPSYAGGRDRNRISLFLEPGPVPAAASRKAQPDATVAEVGCPKLDRITRAPEPVAVACWHWPARIAGGAAGWAHPAWQDQVQTMRQAVEPLTLATHAHPRAAQVIQRWARAVDVPYIDDCQQVLATACLMLVDNSSVAWEAAALNIPVVLLDSPGLPRTADGIWEWPPGPHATPDLLVAAVKDACQGTYWREQRARAADHTYTVKPGFAAASAASAIETWLRSL